MRAPFEDKYFRDMVDKKGKAPELESMLDQLDSRERELCRELREVGVTEQDSEAGELVCALLEFYRLDEREREIGEELQALG